MNASSNTPEGGCARCPICDGPAPEPSETAAEACCAECGQLLRTIASCAGRAAGVAPERVTLESSWDDLQLDSISFVELVMDLEEELDVVIAEDAQQQLGTISDVIRYVALQRRQRRA